MVLQNNPRTSQQPSIPIHLTSEHHNTLVWLGSFTPDAFRSACAAPWACPICQFEYHDACTNNLNATALGGGEWLRACVYDAPKRHTQRKANLQTKLNKRKITKYNCVTQTELVPCVLQNTNIIKIRHSCNKPKQHRLQADKKCEKE